jgi:MerR family mercuric resistance operon transcriptional regulator
MRISEAAAAAGLSLATLGFYERKGLVVQPQRPLLNGRFRSYSQDTLERIRDIKQAQEIGFSLSEIMELLSLRVDPGSDCSEVRKHARAKLTEVKHKIAYLNHMPTALEELIGQCPGKGAALDDCSILAALTTSTLDESGASLAG